MACSLPFDCSRCEDCNRSGCRASPQKSSVCTLQLPTKRGYLNGPRFRDRGHFARREPPTYITIQFGRLDNTNHRLSAVKAGSLTERCSHGVLESDGTRDAIPSCTTTSSTSTVAASATNRCSHSGTSSSGITRTENFAEPQQSQQRANITPTRFSTRITTSIAVGLRCAG